MSNPTEAKEPTMTARKTTPKTITDADRDAAVLAGVTTTAAKPGTRRTPKPVPKPTAKAKASPATKAATNGGAPATTAKVAAAVKAATTGPKPNEVKRELAALIVRAAGDAVRDLPTDELVAVFGGATPEALAAQVSQWLHYLPLGGQWPEGYCPKPDRSDWR
jgi:hypothetical protein